MSILTFGQIKLTLFLLCSTFHANLKLREINSRGQTLTRVRKKLKIDCKHSEEYSTCAGK